MENPGNVFVSQALGNDPKGTGDPVRVLSRPQVTLVLVFLRFCSSKSFLLT